MKMHALYTLVMSALLATSSINAFAANPCALTPNLQDGIGGTGNSVQGGIGGTGRTPQDGLGGTGHQPQSGVGGTGQKLSVVGVITGFASVCVNGEEVHFEDKTIVTINGESANTSSLAVGQIVSIAADQTPKGWTASSIITNDAVSGPITKFNAPNRAVIAGQIVNLPKEFTTGVVKKQLAVGQNIRVQGLRLLNGEILATSATLSNSRQIVISGFVQKLNSGIVRVGGVKVANLARNLAVTGQLISVTGRMVGLTLQVTNARRALQVDTNAQQLSIQSSVLSSLGGRIQLSNGTVINTSIDTAQNFQAGRLVYVYAVKDKNGKWQSTQINNQSQADLMQRAGERQNKSGRGNNNSKNDKDSETDLAEDENSDSGSGLDSNSNSGSISETNSNFGSNSGSGSESNSDSKSNSGLNNKAINLDKSSISERPNAVERSNGVDRFGGSDRPNRSDRSSGSDRPDATDRPSGGDRPSRTDRPAAIDRPSGGDRLRVDRPAAADRPSSSDRSSGGDRIRNEVGGGSSGGGSGRH